MESNGIRIHSLHATSSQQTASQKTPSGVLLMIHGSASNAKCFSDCFPFLCNHFLHVWAVDLPGFGVSTRPLNKYSRNAKDAILECLVRSIHEVVLQCGDSGKVVIAGHSFGAFVAAEYAVNYPAHVECLVLMAPVGLVAREKRSMTGFWWAVFFKDVLPLFSRFWGSAEGVGHFIEIGWKDGTVAWNKPVFKLLVEKNIRFSCLFGEWDTIVPYEELKDLPMKSSVIPKATHTGMLHREFAEIVSNNIYLLAVQK